MIAAACFVSFLWLAVRLADAKPLGGWQGQRIKLPRKFLMEAEV